MLVILWNKQLISERDVSALKFVSSSLQCLFYESKCIINVLEFYRLGHSLWQDKIQNTKPNEKSVCILYFVSLGILLSSSSGSLLTDWSSGWWDNNLSVLYFCYVSIHKFRVLSWYNTFLDSFKLKPMIVNANKLTSIINKSYLVLSFFFASLIEFLDRKSVV